MTNTSLQTKQQYRLIKLAGDNWVFDLEEFIGYYVVVESGLVVDRSAAFSISRESLEAERFMNVPIGILQTAIEVARKELGLEMKHEC